MPAGGPPEDPAPDDAFEAIVARMVLDFRYGEQTARVALRARLHCEYCSLDMLGSAEAYHWNFHVDHLFPRAAGGSDDIENSVLSCMLCNQIKSDWDPSEALPEPQTRAGLVEVSRRYIQERRIGRLREIVELRALVSTAIDL